MNLYEEILRQRQPSKGEGFRCWCCRDQAIIPSDVLRRHGLTKDDGMIGEDSLNPCGVAYLCTRRGCNANWVDIDTSEGSKTVNRYARKGVNPVDPELCQRIHQSEWERSNAANRQTKAMA